MYNNIYNNIKHYYDDSETHKCIDKYTHTHLYTIIPIYLSIYIYIYMDPFMI